MNINNKNILIKVCTLGESFVGKSSLLERLNKSCFFSVRIGSIQDYYLYQIQKFGLPLRFQMLDTAGSERFSCFIPDQFKNCHGVTLVYDIANRTSFEKLQNWIRQLDNSTLKINPIFILIGSKCDLEDQREVSYQEGKQFADSNGFIFYETSAKTALNVKEAYNEWIDNIVEVI